MAEAAPQAVGRHRCHWATWKFSIGQNAYYRGDRAIVLDRHCTIMGHQIFKIWLVDKLGEQTPRYVLSGALT
jgi:hypothetical protein